MEEFLIEPEWKTLWIFIETQLKKYQPECYEKFQNDIEIRKLNAMAKRKGWEVPVGWTDCRIEEAK